MFTLIVHCS